MKKWRNSITLFLTICAFLSTQALAAEQGVGKTPSEGAQAAQKAPATAVKGEAAAKKAATGHADRVSMIVGKQAISQKGEDLGKIEDSVLTKEGCLDFIVLAPEGWFGGGAHYIPIPWKFVKTGVQADTIIIEKDRSQLGKAPAIEKDKWPQIITDNEWYGKVRDFFGGEE
ncbi:PRC-barrel domain-containing protein [Thermodesulfobacteriota bacterium]